MSPRLANLAILALGVGTLACSGVLGRPDESRDFGIPGEKFQTLAVIAGGTSNFDIQVAVRTQRTLEGADYDVSSPAGRWSSPAAAVEALCSEDAETRYDGVIFVVWDDLELRDCETGRVAYHVEGGFGGVEEMTERLVRYLRGEPPK